MARTSGVVSLAGPTLDPRIVTAIGDALRVSYGSLLRQPVPDRFVTLLQTFEEHDGKDRP